MTKIPNWSLAYMVSTAKFVGELPLHTDSHYLFQYKKIIWKIWAYRFYLMIKYTLKDIKGMIP